MAKKLTSARPLFTRLKTARGRTVSSQRWLTRQLNDPYVLKAREAGYRSRAAYKLIEINEKFKIFKLGANVVDLGAAPGGWTQVSLEKVGSKGCVIGIDLTPMDPIEGAQLICGDFYDPHTGEEIRSYLKGSVNVVLSDMAAPSTGHPQTDHMRIMDLAEGAFLFSQEVLGRGGSFVAKVLQGGTERELLQLLKKNFEKVCHFKPLASRSDSAEMYVIALGFRP